MLLLYIALAIYLLAMSFVAFYSLAQAHLLGQFFRFRRGFRAPAALADEALPTVTLQLPLYNERYVVQRLMAAVARLDYPREKLEIQLLDDSTDDTGELLREEMRRYPDVRFRYLHRENRVGFKAGALKEGLAQAEGDLIAIFDADFVPEPDFLRRMVPHFQDPEVGLVQSRWTHLNEHYSLFTRLQALALDTHFMVEQMGRNQAGAFINFNGTGGVWRKACILDAGNWEADTLTEDLDLSYRAQQRGWRFVYRPDVPAPAELPPVMAAIKSQQFRWTKGGAECARKHLRNVWQSPAPLLTKVHATAHLLNAAIFIAVLLTALSSIPLWWGFYAGHIPFDLYAAALFFLLGFVLIAAVYAVANFTLSPKTPGSLLRFFYELPLFLSVSMGLSLHNAGAVWEGLSGKKSAFIRTPKYNLAEGQRGAWAQNVYHRFRIPLSTYVEFGLFLVFGGMVLLGWWTGTRELLLFHGMLCLGFGLVSIASFRST